MQQTARLAMRMTPAWAYSLPFAIYIGFLILESLLPTQGSAANAIDVRWLYAIKVICVFAALAYLWRRYSDLTPLRLPSASSLALALVVGLVVFAIWINLDQPWALLGSMGTGFDPRNDSGDFQWALIAARVAGAALVVPVMEELFWRSFIMRWIDRPNFTTLEPRAVGVKAVLLSSVLFGFEHTQWLAGIVAGVAYGWLYQRSGNLWAPILAHAVTNGTLAAWVLVTEAWHFW